jgi:NAD(P)-dependent dehydrogenase (short-subunit alcohol dehydrogenase family)
MRLDYSNGMASDAKGAGASSARLDSTVAIVTGGSRGIGLAIATALAGRGARVAIMGRDQSHLDRAVAALPKDAAMGVRADVGNAVEVAAAIDAAAHRFGGLDVLVNSAGIGTFGNVAGMSAGDWSAVIGTNLTGVFHCCHAALPHLKSRGGGWIINISSLASTNPFVGGAAYCASKAGLNAFTDVLMQEVRYDNIRVSCVLPGSVATGFGGRSGDAGADWKVAASDVADVVLELVTFPARSLPSRIELRPSRPPRK